MQITTSEHSVLRALLTNDFTAFNGGIPARYGMALDWAVWTADINSAAEPSTVEGRALSGVVSSLVQKGLVSSEGGGKNACTRLTEEGFKVAVEKGPCAG